MNYIQIIEILNPEHYVNDLFCSFRKTQCRIYNVSVMSDLCFYTEATTYGVNSLTETHLQEVELRSELARTPVNVTGLKNLSYIKEVNKRKHSTANCSSAQNNLQCHLVFGCVNTEQHIQQHSGINVNYDVGTLQAMCINQNKCRIICHYLAHVRL